jgi:DNA-binding GntR family transcriptional regulator
VAPRATAAGTGTAGARRPEGALYVRVAEQLRSRIEAHQLAPGSWIDEQVLTAELGISRTPLREALKVLAGEGLVTMKPRRGAYVTEVSARDLAEVYHLLALLESDAAADVAAHATAADVADLDALHTELESNADDRDRFFAANERFHRRLLELGGNRWRHQLVADLRQVMKLNRHHSLFRQGRVEASLKEHRRILAALKAGDAPQAQALMRQHFANGLQAAAPD